MKQLLLVGPGGFVGSVARYKLGGFILHHSASWRFSAEHVRCQFVSVLRHRSAGAVAARQDFFSRDARLFLFTGVLCGYTTFSAFGFEGFLLLRRRDVAVAVVYACLSVLVGFIAVWLALDYLAATPRF